MTARPEPPCALNGWCALGLGHAGGCSIARPRGNRTPVDVLVKAGLALLELGVSTKQLTRSDFILFPDPVGETVNHHPADVDAQVGEASIPEAPRGTSAAFEASAHTAQSYAYRYKKLAGQLAEILEEMTHLAEAEIRDPGNQAPGTISGRYKPALLASRAVRYDGQDAGTKIERVQMDLQARAGVWETEAARLRYRGAQLEADETSSALPGFPKHNHAPTVERVPGCPLCDVAAEVESKGGAPDAEG